MPTENESYPECIQCGYVLAHLREPRCPECGAVYDESYLRQTGQYRRRQRRRRAAFIAIATLLALAVIGVTQRTTLPDRAGRAWAWLHTDRMLVEALITEDLYVPNSEPRFRQYRLRHREFLRRMNERNLSRGAETRLLNYLQAYCNPRIEFYSFNPELRTVRFALVEWTLSGRVPLVGGTPYPIVRVVNNARGLRMEPGLVGGRKTVPGLQPVVMYYEATIPQGDDHLEVVASRQTPRQLLWWPNDRRGTLTKSIQRSITVRELASLPVHNPSTTTQPDPVTGLRLRLAPPIAVQRTFLDPP